MNINSPFPIEVDALIEQLDTLYPDRAPHLSLQEKEVWFRSGQVSVVTFLKAWRKASLEKHPNVYRQDSKGESSGVGGKASAGVHEQVLRGSRGGRRRGKGRKERTQD